MSQQLLCAVYSAGVVGRPGQEGNVERRGGRNVVLPFFTCLPLCAQTCCGMFAVVMMTIKKVRLLDSFDYVRFTFILLYE